MMRGDGGMRGGRGEGGSRGRKGERERGSGGQDSSCFHGMQLQPFSLDYDLLTHKAS